MRCILKKIAVRKFFNENISDLYFYGSRSRSQKLSNGSRAACQLDYHLLRMFSTIAFRLHPAVYLHSVIGWQTRTLLLNEQSRTWQRCEYPLFGYALLYSTHAGSHTPPTCGVRRRRAILCDTHNERTIDTHTANKGMMWAPGPHNMKPKRQGSRMTEKIILCSRSTV